MSWDPTVLVETRCRPAPSDERRTKTPGALLGCASSQPSHASLPGPDHAQQPRLIVGALTGTSDRLDPSAFMIAGLIRSPSTTQTWIRVPSADHRGHSAGPGRTSVMSDPSGFAVKTSKSPMASLNRPNKIQPFCPGVSPWAVPASRVTLVSSVIAATVIQVRLI